MAQQPHLDDLTELRARLDAQEIRSAAQEAEIARLKRRRRIPCRFLPLALVGLLVALLPLSILAAGPVFSDLGTAAPVHQPNIQAIGDAGITTGFEDPANPGQRTYNPKGLVTREEMASFLARTAGLGGNQPVANAKTAQMAQTAVSATNAQNAVTAQTAGNANTVGGYAPSGLVRVARAFGINDYFAVASIFPAFTSAPGATLTITVPGNGFVLVTGAVTVGPHTNDGVIYARLRDTSPGAAATAVSPLMFFRDDNDAAAPTSAYGGLSPTFVFPVTGAGTKTFVLELAADAAGTNEAYAPTVTALYVPFGYDGGTTLAP